MAKKTGGQNPVDEAYLRSLMAGGPSEPLSSPAPSITGESGGNRATALSDEKGKADNNVNGTVRDISGADDIGCSELVTDKPSPKTIRTTLADFIRKFLTPYKCEGRQGVCNYIDNVLKEHFEKHADEVKTYLQKSYNKIF